MYLLDAEEEAIPALRDPAAGARRLARRRRRRGSVERARARRRRRRRRSRRASTPAALAGSGSPTSPSRSAGRARSAPSGAGARWSRWPPATGSPGSSAKLAPSVIESGPGRRPSTGEILDAIEQTHAHEVVVLPNDPDSVGVAGAAAAAAEESGDVRVVVVPTRAQVQGIAAIAVHEPGPQLRLRRGAHDLGGPRHPPRRGDGGREAGDDHRRAVRAGRRARCPPGRLRDRR